MLPVCCPWLIGLSFARRFPKYTGCNRMEDALLPGGGAAPPPQHPRRATVRSTVLNVFTLICYPYGVPYCFGQMGWVLGSVFLVGSTWINVEAGVALGEICARRPELTSFPKVVRAAFGGRWGAATLWLQYGSYWLTNVYNFVITAEYWTESGVLTTWCEQRFMFLTYVLIVPLIQLPDYHAMAPAALFSNAVIVLGVLSLFWVAYVQGGPEPGVDYETAGFGRASRGGVSMAFALAGAGVFPELIAEMKHPDQFARAVRCAFLPIFLLYAACGLAGFWLFGGDAAGDILRNFPPNLAATHVTAFLMALSFLVSTVENNLFMVLGIERAAAARWPGLRETAPRTKSFLFRAAFLASELVVAAALRGAGAGDMQALAGAVSGPALCYAAPFACHLALFAGEHSRPRRWAFLAFVVAGGLLCVFGTYYSVLGVVEAASSYTIFGGSCRLAAERA